LTEHTTETGDIALRHVQNARRIPKQILDLLHQKEKGRQELACFLLHMVIPKWINVSLNRTMVAWGGALSTRPMTEDGDIAKKINVQISDTWYNQCRKHWFSVEEGWRQCKQRKDIPHRFLCNLKFCFVFDVCTLFQFAFLIFDFWFRNFNLLKTYVSYGKTQINRFWDVFNALRIWLLKNFSSKQMNFKRKICRN